MRKAEVVWAAWVLALAGAGCDAFSERPGEGNGAPRPGSRPDSFPTDPVVEGVPGGSSGVGGSPGIHAGGSAGTPASNGLGLHVAETPPPPIQGGTLEVVAEGTVAVVADPARDRVSFVRLDNRDVSHVELEKGDEPGRIVEDGAGRVHVALRGTGEVATIEPEADVVSSRRMVCSSLRGLAYHADEGALLAACASGRLVTVPVEGDTAPRRDYVADDLRDVWIQGSTIQVSRFKTAEVLSLDADRSIVQRAVPQEVVVNRGSVRVGDVRARHMAPTTAWRVRSGADVAYMIHQSAQIEPIDLGATDHAGDAGTVPPGPPPGQSPYGGGGDGCGGIVRATLDRITPDGILERGRIGSLAMAVDVAASPDGEWLAFAMPGQSTPSDFGLLPRVTPENAGVVVVPTEATFGEPAVGNESCQVPFEDFPAVMVLSREQVTSVAFDDQGRLLVQNREPASLTVIEPERLTAGNVIHRADERDVSLGGASVRDTGHDLFHMVTPAGIACASCHPAGAEDGHVWRFEPIGPRRSQALHVGLEGSAPFHWDGDQENVLALMNEVFVRRMGGPEVDPPQAERLASWMFALKPPAPKRLENEPAVERGKALFESEETQCASCHSGPTFTNHSTADVGTGGAFQVPSLVGVAYRAPLMHDGCAEDLRARFLDLECGGGDDHGRTTHLNEAQLSELIAYLESL